LLVKVLVPGFTAREDFKTPVRFGVYATLISLALNVLAWPFAHAGLALATSLGALVNAGLLLNKLLKSQVYKPGDGWRLFLLRVGCASSAMAGVLYARVDPGAWYQQHAMGRVIDLLICVALGLAVYAVVLMVVGLRPRHLKMRRDTSV